jgi:hypothetical protein
LPRHGGRRGYAGCREYRRRVFGELVDRRSRRELVDRRSRRELVDRRSIFGKLVNGRSRREFVNGRSYRELLRRFGAMNEGTVPTDMTETAAWARRAAGTYTYAEAPATPPGRSP